jgi:RNA polymerase sigma factor (sigma-70 family)
MKICQKYIEPGGVEDLHSAVITDLFENIELFDPKRGRFSTWATWRVRHVSDRFRLKERVMYVPKIPVGMVNGLVHDDFVEVKDDRAEKWQPSAEESKLLIDAMATLSDRERYVLALRSQGATLDQISKIIGVVRERVRQILDETIAKLRSIVCQE